MTFVDQYMGDESPARRRRICMVATVPFAFNVFMRSHIDLLKVDYDVTLVANGAADELEGLLGEHVTFVAMPIERKISLKEDVLALIKLWLFFRREKFDGVCFCRSRDCWLCCRHAFPAFRFA